MHVQSGLAVDAQVVFTGFYNFFSLNINSFAASNSFGGCVQLRKLVVVAAFSAERFQAMSHE